MIAEGVGRKISEAHNTEHPHIDRVEGVCGGQPKIRGTRLPVWIIAGWEAIGHTADEIVGMYPNLSAAQVHDALSYYYDHKEEIDKVRQENSYESFQSRNDA